MSKLIFTFLFFLVLCIPAYGWDGNIVSVHDGDTITVSHSQTGEKIKIRLYGIDAPELPSRAWTAQPYSKKSCNFLRNLLPVSSRVAIKNMGVDRYMRTVAHVVSLPSQKMVQEELLKAGLAWVYPQYCKNCEQWKTIEAEAREARRGLWRSDNPVPPWEWRKK